MISSIQIVAATYQHTITVPAVSSNKVVIDCSKLLQNGKTSFTIEITFFKPIKAFRNHDYSWASVERDRVANAFCSKIIQLEETVFVQANSTNGIWEVKKSNPNQLLWHFNPSYSNGLTYYSGRDNQKTIEAAQSTLSWVEQPTLLFTHQPIEISRSLYPFSAIACFTDHCDYDTNENLKRQRAFFAETSIKVTKGFFLNHFSKRNDNASFENDFDEIEQWRNGGHELAYHSLSQSIKPIDKSFRDFESFQPPYSDISVWIDHGFQPYNLSFYQNNNYTSADFEANLKTKNISVLWNYIDSGTATKGVFNQLNMEQFTLETFSKAIRHFPFKARMVQFFKNIIFHYDNHPKRIRNYIDAVANVRAIVQKKQARALFSFVGNVFPLLLLMVKVLVSWNSIKSKPYKVARYAPLLFKHRIHQHDFQVFQTLEMVDFSRALTAENIDGLIHESGVFIAHTYFSVDMQHHSGKLFKSKTQLDDQVVSNFNYLATKVKENKIWNPTLSELIAYWNQYEKTIFDVDSNGKVILKNGDGIAFRVVV